MNSSIRQQYQLLTFGSENLELGHQTYIHDTTKLTKYYS